MNKQFIDKIKELNDKYADKYPSPRRFEFEIDTLTDNLIEVFTHKVLDILEQNNKCHIIIEEIVSDSATTK